MNKIQSKHKLFYQKIDASYLAEQIIAFFIAIRKIYPDAVLLENSEEGFIKKSIISFDTMARFRGHHHTNIGLKEFRQFMEDFSCESTNSASSHIGNVVGFFAYDTVRFFEEIPNQHPQNNTPDLAFNIYRMSLCFDHRTKELHIQHIVNNNENNSKELDDFNQFLKKFASTIDTNNVGEYYSPLQNSTLLIEPDIDDNRFKEIVHQAKNYIHSGDIFQVVLSRTFQCPYTEDPLKIYQTLRKNYPTPYLFYIPMDDFSLVGASPETCVKVDNKLVSVNPIAGTRKRTKSLEEQEMDLLNDDKELAEHMMLVDLARNDLGRVSKIGSINIAELLKVKHFSHVSHITSTITGELLHHLDALDALAAAFPAGTLSGAPKIRAMEIIDELENSRRNIYGGAICCLDFEGNLDSCIAIRMATIKNGMASFRTGAGIVADSDPQAEANETRHKAQAMIDAIGEALCY